MTNKYTFNPENLDYQQETKLSKITKIILGQIVAIIFFALIVFYILSYTIDSPVEKNLKHENSILKAQYIRLYNEYKNNEKKLALLEAQDSDLYKAIFATNPKNEEIQTDVPDFGQVRGRGALKIAYINNKHLKELWQNLRSSRKKYVSFMDSLKNSQKKLSKIPSMMPVPYYDTNFQIYGFGIRLDATYHIPFFHSGIDIKAPFGTPVFATANGIVQSANTNKRKGRYIVIKHGDYTTDYEHLQKMNVRQGQRVKRGQVIGYVGSSGKSLIEHLHYEIKYKGKYVNPIFYFFTDFNPVQFMALYKKSQNAGISLD
jgi:murein DD-endopeptidase MepM/ murein hydrolase activator NlpD